MTKRERNAYFAGLLDGEGYFGLAKKKYNLCPTIKVNMTCEKTVRAIQKHFGRGTVRPRKSSHKPQWVWRVYYYDALLVARAVRPFLITKRKQADKLIEVQTKERP